VRELTLTRLWVMLREPEVIFWVFAFPVLLALGLGVAFRDPPPEPVRVGVERGSPAEAHIATLAASGEVDPVVLAPGAALDALRRGEVAVVAGGDASIVLRYDPTRPEGRSGRALVDAALQEAGGADRPVEIREEEVRQRGARYIDWLIPGLVGFNLLSTSLWAIGFYIVQMRQNRQLKRLVATPMRRSDFLVSQVLARMVFVAVEIPLLVLFAWLVFGVQVEGSIAALALLVVLGAACFSGLGLLAAARARTTEGVSGIINVIMMPMLVLSGVFFSASRFPDAVQPLIQVLPLTALNDALRAVYNDGLGLAAVPAEVAILLAWTAASFLLALRWFRWQ